LISDFTVLKFAYIYFKFHFTKCEKVISCLFGREGRRHPTAEEAPEPLAHAALWLIRPWSEIRLKSVPVYTGHFANAKK